MNRSLATALTILVTLTGGCVEISQILAPPPPPEEEIDWTVFGTSNNADDADTSGVDDAATTGVEDLDTNGDTSDDVDTTGVEDIDTNGDTSDDVDTTGVDDDTTDDADTTGLDDADTNGDDETTGIPPLPDDAILTTTESGLQTYDFETGTGDQPPDLNATVRVDYVGYLPDGTIFDSNEDATFSMSGLIEGFAEGVLTMKVGGRRRIIIPPDLGYGPGGNPGAGIGGEDTITFDVTLLEVVSP